MNLAFVLQVLELLRKRLFLLIMVPLLCVAGTAYFSFYVMVPLYEASTTLLVKPQTLNQDIYNSVLGNQQLIKTYDGLIQTRKIAQDAIRKLELQKRPEDLLENLNVKTSNVTFIINVSYKDPDPVMAVRIVNEISRSFSQNVNLFMNVDNVMIVDEAEYQPDTAPISPKPYLNMAAAFFISLAFMVFLVILMEALRSIKRKPRKKVMEVGQLEKANNF